MSAPRPNSAEQLGGCTLIEKIDEGGGGIVWKAHQSAENRFVAIKFLRENPTPEQRRRFELEIAAAAFTSHENLVSQHFSQPQASPPFFVMEYCGGGTVKDVAKPCAAEGAVRIIMAAAKGMASLHSRGLVHRDIKPSNLFLTDGKVVKVGDFGLAKLPKSEGEFTFTKTDSPLHGTPEYMSPKQAKSFANADPKDDVWALGAVLYELLTAIRPVQGKRDDVIASLLNSNTPRIAPLIEILPAICPKLSRIVEACFATGINQQYKDASELFRILQQWIEWKESARYRISKFSRSGIGLLFFATITALVFAVGWFWMDHLNRQEVQRRVLAESAEKVAKDALASARQSDARGEFAIADRILAQKDGNPSEAVAHLARALRVWPDYWQASDRLLSLLEHRRWFLEVGRPFVHGPNLQSFAISPDDRFLVTAGNGKFRLWDIVNQSQAREDWSISSEQNSPSAIAISNDGTRIAALYSRTKLIPQAYVIVLEAGGGAVSARMIAASERDANMSDVIPQLAFSPDDSFIAFADGAKNASVFRLADNKLLHTVTMDSGIQSLCFSPDSKVLAVGDESNTIALSKLDGGAKPKFYSIMIETAGPKSALLSVMCLRFSAQNQLNIVERSNFALRWVCDDWVNKEPMVVVTKSPTQYYETDRLCILPDAKSIVSNVNGDIRVRGFSSNQETWAPLGPLGKIKRFELSPLGSIIALSSFSGEIVLKRLVGSMLDQDFAKGWKDAKFEMGKTGRRELKITPEFEYYHSQPSYSYSKDLESLVRANFVPLQKAETTFTTKTEDLRGELTTDVILSRKNNGTLQWNTPLNDLTDSFTHSGEIKFVTFGNQNFAETVFTSGSDGTIFGWRLPDCKREVVIRSGASLSARSISRLNSNAGIFYVVEFDSANSTINPDQTNPAKLESDPNRFVRVFAGPTGEPIGPPIPMRAKVGSIARYQNGLILQSELGELRCIDFDRRAVIFTCENTNVALRHMGAFWFCKPLDERTFLFGNTKIFLCTRRDSHDELIECGDLWTEEMRVEAIRRGIYPEYASVVVQTGASGKCVFVWSTESASWFVIWDLKTRKFDGKPFWFSGPITGVQFTSDGTLLLVATDDALRIWDVANNSMKGDLSCGGYPRAIDVSGDRLALSDGYSVTLWDIKTAQQISDPIQFVFSGTERQQSIEKIDFLSATSLRAFSNSQNEITVDIPHLKGSTPEWFTRFAERVGGITLTEGRAYQRTSELQNWSSFAHLPESDAYGQFVQRFLKRYGYWSAPGF